MVRDSIAAAAGRRANSCLAGVLGSSGLASGGSGFGLRVPLSCALAAPVRASPMATATTAARELVASGRRVPIQILMIHLLGEPPPRLSLGRGTPLSNENVKAVADR